jgi:hypothetical protein
MEVGLAENEVMIGLPHTVTMQDRLTLPAEFVAVRV